MEDSVAKCEIDERDALFKLELKKGIVGQIVYVVSLNLGQGRFWKMGPDEGVIERGGR